MLCAGAHWGVLDDVRIEYTASPSTIPRFTGAIDGETDVIDGETGVYIHSGDCVGHLTQEGSPLPALHRTHPLDRQ